MTQISCWRHSSTPRFTAYFFYSTNYPPNIEASLGPGFLGISKHSIRRFLGSLFSYHSMADRWGGEERPAGVWWLEGGQMIRGSTD